MPIQEYIVHFFNLVLGAPVAFLLKLVGHPPADPSTPIDGTFAIELLVVLILIAFFMLVRATLNVERPGPAQHIAEMLNEFVSEQGESIIGHGYQRFQPFLTAIFCFVLLCGLIGLIPGIDTPTAKPVVPLAIAILTFLYYNGHGVREQGPVGYVKHFMGPLWWIAPLMFPIEIISHLSRILSLTIRLYANMYASDLLSLIFFSLVPIGLPVVFLGLHTLVSFIQAYVFMLLGMIYIGQAVAHEDH